MRSVATARCIDRCARNRQRAARLARKPTVGGTPVRRPADRRADAPGCPTPPRHDRNLRSTVVVAHAQILANCIAGARRRRLAVYLVRDRRVSFANAAAHELFACGLLGPPGNWTVSVSAASCDAIGRRSPRKQRAGRPLRASNPKRDCECRPPSAIRLGVDPRASDARGSLRGGAGAPRSLWGCDPSRLQRAASSPHQVGAMVHRGPSPLGERRSLDAYRAQRVA
jgi:hypothetical protein